MAEADEHAARLLGERAPPPRRFRALRKGEMDETGRSGESRSARRLGQPFNAKRSADANLLVENECGELARAWQLAGAAGQHDEAAGALVEAAVLEPVAHQLERLLEPRRDDADEERARHLVGLA